MFAGDILTVLGEYSAFLIVGDDVTIEEGDVDASNDDSAESTTACGISTERGDRSS